MSVKILNVTIRDQKQDDLLQDLRKGILVTPNVDHLVQLQKDREFYEVYRKADYIVCDSKILALCSKCLKTSIQNVIPGSNFFPAYYKYHKNNPEIKIFLLGAAAGVGEVAKEKINKKVGREIVVGTYSPPMGFEHDTEENKKIIQLIEESGATTLAVGLGAPKQEKWIIKYKDVLPTVDVFMAIGATIDFESGLTKRAPKIYQKLCLEWFYRFLEEPKRMFKRYFLDDTKFFWLFFKQILGVYKDPFKQKEFK